MRGETLLMAMIMMRNSNMPKALISSMVAIAMTNPNVKKIIAPKYWARHNVSDGYWSSPQNIYGGFLYMDRSGRLQTAEECRAEWEKYEVAEGSPLPAGDPAVVRMRKKQERERLVRKAAAKIRRMLFK